MNVGDKVRVTTDMYRGIEGESVNDCIPEGSIGTITFVDEDHVLVQRNDATDMFDWYFKHGEVELVQVGGRDERDELLKELRWVLNFYDQQQTVNRTAESEYNARFNRLYVEKIDRVLEAGS